MNFSSPPAFIFIASRSKPGADKCLRPRRYVNSLHSIRFVIVASDLITWTRSLPDDDWIKPSDDISLSIVMLLLDSYSLTNCRDANRTARTLLIVNQSWDTKIAKCKTIALGASSVFWIFVEQYFMPEASFDTLSDSPHSTNDCETVFLF